MARITAILISLLFLLSMLAAAGGYVANIFKLVAMTVVNDASVALFFARVVGIVVVPVGVVLGWL